VSRRRNKELIALDHARTRRDGGDPLPFMVILKQERDKIGIVPPVEKSRRRVETVRSDLL
jgi:hypothetical protein